MWTSSSCKTHRSFLSGSSFREETEKHTYSFDTETFETAGLNFTPCSNRSESVHLWFALTHQTVSALCLTSSSPPRSDFWRTPGSVCCELKTLRTADKTNPKILVSQEDFNQTQPLSFIWPEIRLRCRWFSVSVPAQAPTGSVTPYTQSRLPAQMIY